jgi:hypothetical protein
MSENGKQAFRNASIYGGEMTLWVSLDRGELPLAPPNVRFVPVATKMITRGDGQQVDAK